MPSGTIRWFNKDQGFGFIIPDEGGKDIYVQRANIDTPDHELMDYQRVEYETIIGRKGLEAIHVRSLN